MATRKKFLERTRIPKWLAYTIIALWILLLMVLLYATIRVSVSTNN